MTDDSDEQLDDEQNDEQEDDEDMETEELRRNMLHSLREADGAFAVTAKLADQDEDGEYHSVAVSVGRFTVDDIDLLDKLALRKSITESVVEHGIEGNAKAIQVEGDDPASAMQDVMEKMARELGLDAPSIGDDDEGDRDEPMFQ